MIAYREKINCKGILDMALVDTPGGRLRQARADMYLSGVEFLELVNARLGSEKSLSPAHLTHIEKGDRNPSIDMLIAMADVLELSLDYIYDRDVKKEEPYSAEVMRAADMLESMDEDTRALILHNIERVYALDQERRELHQEIYDLLTREKPDKKRSLVVTSRLRNMHRSINAS